MPNIGGQLELVFMLSLTSHFECALCAAVVITWKELSCTAIFLFQHNASLRIEAMEKLKLL